MFRDDLHFRSFSQDHCQGQKQTIALIEDSDVLQPQRVGNVSEAFNACKGASHKGASGGLTCPPGVNRDDFEAILVRCSRLSDTPSKRCLARFGSGSSQGLSTVAFTEEVEFCPAFL